MTHRVDHPDLATACHVLREHGAQFVLAHGSRVTGTARPGSDLDLAAWFASDVDVVEVNAALPDGVDLLVLDTAPLELAGRVALHGVVVDEVDAGERVAWQATTRKVYLDEQPRIRRARQDFVKARAGG